jgi:hypothetical protein
MAAAVAPRFFQEHGILKLPHFLIVYTRFKGLRRDSEGLATELQHFRHERKIIESSLLVQGCNDFSFGAYFNQISR